MDGFCAFYGCFNRTKRSFKDFFSFPYLNHSLCCAWLYNANKPSLMQEYQENKMSMASKLLCEDHFDPSSFSEYTSSVKKLRGDAIPVAFNKVAYIQRCGKKLSP